MFGAVKLTKNAYFDKYQYSGYGIGLGRTSSLFFQGGGFVGNVTIFGGGMNSSVHINNKK